VRVQDSASAHRPSGSTMAPSSLCSAVARQSTGSTGLPRLSGLGSSATCSAAVCQTPGVITALAWVPPGAACSKSLLSPAWLLPPSSLITSLDSICRPPPG
ncbi:hypothetical protein M9458_047028, partial [Cirrhinus mrigala]